MGADPRVDIISDALRLELFGETAATQLLFINIVLMADRQGRLLMLKNDLAEAIGLSADTVHKRLNRLKELRLIQKVSRPNVGTLIEVVNYRRYALSDERAFR